MLKQFLIGGFVGISLAIASAPSQAQTTPASPSPASPAPAPSPASPASPAPEQTSPQATQVSAEEVQQFAEALKQMRSIHESAQSQAAAAIQQQGLTPERFTQIAQGQQDPQAETQVSQEERQKFDQALTQVTQIQQTTEQQMEQAIQSTGLDVQRFQQIFAIARQDQQLKDRIQQVLQN
ncbi:DUF4168 domain-containing protein [Phormidium tenue FACHB-886]|nr:DUF4168 domain-containing protein [Phormidium tenue FACHB-886]